MWKLSKKVEYALMAVLHMDTLTRDEVASAKEISEEYRIPPDLLGKVLQALARSGIAESVHGARGGYRLGRPLSELTLGDIMAAIEGPINIVKCHDHPEECDQYGVCNIRGPVLRMQDQLLSYLRAFRISDFRWQSRKLSKQGSYK